MKKYTLYLLCLFVTIYTCNGINSVVATSPDIGLLIPKTCHTFLGIDFFETKEIIPGSRRPIPGDHGMSYAYEYKGEFNCSQADKQYFIFLIIVFILLSVVGYFGYKKYKARKLITQSNIESKNTSPVNPE